MTNKSDPNQKHYFTATGKNELENNLISHCRNNQNSEITIWLKGDSPEDAEIYHITNYDPKEHCIYMDATGVNSTRIKGSPKSGKDVLIKIPISDKLNYFGIGHLVFIPTTLSYKLLLSDEIYKSQARNSYRIETSNVIKINIVINQITYDCLDLSIGGTSIIIRNVDIEKFVPSTEISKCVLNFNMKSYNIPTIKIMSISPFKLDNSDQKFHKIGISFKDLPNKVKDELYIEISTEARGQEIKNEFDQIINKKKNNL